MSLRASLGSRGCLEATELKDSRHPSWRGVSERLVAAASSVVAFEILWDEDRSSWVSVRVDGGCILPSLLAEPLWLYWVPAQYVRAIKKTLLGRN
ncbi:hypothetical protein MRX96_009404 [Rhipicephalus microplus]